MSKHQSLKKGDPILVTDGRYKGEKGKVEKASVEFPGEYICIITSLIPNRLAMLKPAQFCKNSITKSTY